MEQRKMTGHKQLHLGKGENDPHSQLWQLRFTWVNVFK